MSHNNKDPPTTSGFTSLHWFPNISRYMRDIPAAPPKLYADIGKEVRDLFHKDYQKSLKISVATSDIAVLQSIVQFQTKESKRALANWSNSCGPSIDIVKECWSCTTSATRVPNRPWRYDAITEFCAPGLKTVFLITSEEGHGKVEVQYQQKFVGISATIAGMFVQPRVDFSCTIGERDNFLGTSLSFDTSTSKVTKIDCGCSLKLLNMYPSFTMTDKFNIATVSCWYPLETDQPTNIGYHLVYDLSTRSSIFKVGAEHAFAFGTLTGWLDNFFRIAADFQYVWKNTWLVISMKTRLDDFSNSLIIGFSATRQL